MGDKKGQNDQTDWKGLESTVLSPKSPHLLLEEGLGRPTGTGGIITVLTLLVAFVIFVIVYDRSSEPYHSFTSSAASSPASGALRRRSR